MKKREYRVIVDDGLGKLQREVSDLGTKGYRAILMAMNSNDVVAITMERTSQTEENNRPLMNGQ
jgi:hypothetical protein